MGGLGRRGLLGALAAGSLPAGGAAGAEERDSVAIAWPADVPGWDPQRLLLADAQPVYRMVFDPPLARDARLELEPALVTQWEMAPDGCSLELALRDDVAFHDGSRLTSADLRWSFLERLHAVPGLDAARVWRRLEDIETPSRDRAVMRFDGPAPWAVAWLGFLGSFVVPRGRGAGDGVGSGPFRLVEHRPGERIVLERHDAWWGPKPALRRVVLEIMREAGARVAAVQSGRVDMAVGVPARELPRLGAVPGLEVELRPVSRLVLLQVSDDGGFADPNVRLAAHHAIDKEALVRAFTHGVGMKLSLPALPGSAGFEGGFTFPHDPNQAILLLERSGFSLESPAQVRLAATRGQFPGDFDMARAIVAMWRAVGIEAVLEVIDGIRHLELARAGRLPEAVLWSMDAGAGVPEAGIGALLDRGMPFSAWREEGLGDQAAALAGLEDEAERSAQWQALARAAVAAGACMPLLQGVQTVVRAKALSHRPSGTGWVLPHTMAWL
jgi:peptide/nickel transport system substrate-binding protein